MNLFFDFGRSLRGLQKASIVCLAIGVAFAVGCGKSGSSTPSVVSTPAASNTISPAAATSAPVAAPQPMQSTVAVNSSDTKASLQALNRALMGWMIRNHRHPQSFQEFAASANVKIPNPPAGKKYALNSRGFIVLVDN